MEDGLGAGGPGGGELGPEILVALAVLQVGRNLPARGGELLPENPGDADAVGVVHGGDHGHARDAQGLARKLGQHGALERIDEADAEDVVAGLGHPRVGGGDGDHRHVRTLEHGGGLERVGRGIAPEHGHHVVAGDKFLGDGGGLARLGLVVLGSQLQRPAEHAAGGVELLDREDDAAAGGEAEGGFLAGESAVLADDDRLGGGEGGGQAQGGGQEKQAEGKAHRERQTAPAPGARPGA